MAKKPKPSKLAPPGSVLTKNRRALHNYHVLARFEVGIQLLGSEVKSIRAGKISLLEAYAHFGKGELYLHGAHIAEYVQAHRRNHEALRPRKLLMHRRELNKLEQELQGAGNALIPLSMYLKDGRVKLELGLCKGKQLHDKRAAIRERDQKREMDRAIRSARG